MRVALPQWLKRRLRAAYRRSRRTLVRVFLSYGPRELVVALHALGVRPGDSVMLHSAFEAHHGFRGSTDDAINAVLEAIGPQGNLLMVSLPYRTSSRKYLDKLTVFDVRRTPSAMGLVSESFRRRRDVVRSLSPTHPILAHGPNADWFVAGHEHALYPCGPGTPFEKLLDAGGKVLFFNAPFEVFTFFHHLEHRVQTHLKFPLYEAEPREVPVIDAAGTRRFLRTHVFSQDAIRRRRFEVLHRWLRAKGIIRRKRIGASVMLLADLHHVTESVDEMLHQGIFFYDMTPDG